jgi:antitoxin (DNA-binding transcriptional repressor) of toxin-antitoxin stability system
MWSPADVSATYGDNQTARDAGPVRSGILQLRHHVGNSAHAGGAPTIAPRSERSRLEPLRDNTAMHKTIAQRALRNDNATVIDAVAAGESFVVTRNGVPVAELRPIRAARRTFVPKTEILALVAVGPHIGRRAFRADLDSVSNPNL